MGQVNEKPFVEACKPKYGAEADTKALELCSMWQDNLRDANWHPFKIVTTGEKSQVGTINGVILILLPSCLEQTLADK